MRGVVGFAPPGAVGTAEPDRGSTLDLDSFSLLHEDGHQEGVRVGCAHKGLKPCHRPIIAALAEVPHVAHYWLRPDNTARVNGAASFLAGYAEPFAPGRFA